ncbi:MAG: low molecular weight protein-tyrosine-phosphatase [Mariprofundaceae bacterium]
MKKKPVRILFVCLGNICRSPLAEVIAWHHIQQQPLQHDLHIASAGTGNWHIGKGADRRSAQTSLAHALDLSAHQAQQINSHGIENWDWFVAMDRDNYSDLIAMGVDQERLLLMRQFEKAGEPDVPDPYYGGSNGFEHVFAILESNMPDVISHITDKSFD